MGAHLLSWNVNGLRAVHRKGLFLDFLQQEAPDVLCIQETKSTVEQLPPPLLQVPGYRAYFSSAERGGYSGVAMYSRVEPLSIERSFGPDGRWDSEGRVLVMDTGPFLLLTVYFPNGQSSAERLRYKLAFYDDFLDHLEGLRAKGRAIVVCGDVNTAHAEIDLARPKENQRTSGFLPVERAWIDRLIGLGYVDTFRRFVPEDSGHYTYWDQKSRARDRNVGWRIDYFFVSPDLADRLTGADILPQVIGSDHCPIGIDLAVDL